MSNTSFIELQSLIINFFPSPIAVNYQRAIAKGTWQDKTRQLMLSFEFTIRALALVLVSQYLLVDREKVSDGRLNMILKEKLPKPSLGSWVEILFTALSTYKKHRDLMFMPELYDTYWDVNQQKPQKGIREPFDKLVVIRNRLAHELPPQDDAGWQALFEESHELLLRVFEFIRFISKYDLIFITGQDEDQFHYKVYRGQEIKESNTSVHLRNDVKPGNGWFYLSSGDGKGRRLLKLYPFLIAWEKDIDLAIDGVQSDAALLDKFSSSRIYYLATVLWENFFRQDEDLLADFFYNYEMSLGNKIKEKRLSWTVLKETTQEIIEQNMGDSIKKYNSQLYLEREEVREVFEGFLASDKTCLVVTGKSGVGKTNFVMAAIEAFRNNPRVCTLAYNGARLPTDSSVSELFRSDLIARLELSPQMIRGKEDVWEILSGIPDISEKQVVVFIDAINENSQASEVLKRLDLLIGSNLHRWLKIVITSRPEAWRVMNRRIRLAEHRYYWRSGEDEMGVELQEFSQTDPASLTINIEKFSRNEAELAYQKYRDIFRLGTDYTELAIEIRQALQDPLMLRLIAEIYRNNPIPPTLRVNQVYADFVNALVASRRLHPEDVVFLQNNLIPRMAAKLNNTLLEDDILADKALYEEIFNTDVLSNRRQVNQSYANLVDAEILVAPSQKEATKIAFRYERFYDYFMGEHYYKKYHNISNTEVRYQELAESVRAHPFLWGAVKNSLISELEAGQEELLYKLACQPDQALREFVISVLTEYGQGKSDQAVILRLTKRLLAVHRERLGFWGRLRAHLPGKVVEQVDPIGRGAAMTALEVARRLRLADVLDEAVQDPSQYVRVIAMRNIYHYWRLDPNAGFNLLQQLAGRVMTPLGFPRVTVLEACLGTTMLVMGHYHPQDEQGREVGIRLLSIWQDIIRRLLFISRVETAGRRVFRSVIRNLLIDIIIRFVITTQESLPNTRKSFLGDVSLFFTAIPIVKDRYSRLVRFLDKPGKIEIVKSDFLDAVTANDSLTSSLLWLILIPQATIEFEEVRNLIIEIAQKDLSQQKVGLYAAPAVTGLAYIVTQQAQIDDNLFHMSQRLIIQYLDKTRGVFYSSNGTPHNNPALGEYVILINRRRNPEDTNLSAHYLEIALHENDRDFLERILLDIPVLANVFNGPKYALDAIAQLFPLPNDLDLIEKIVSALAKIRSYYPELVDEFLLNIEKSNEIFDKVIRQESKEQPWADLLQASIGPAILKLIKTPEVRNELAKLLSLAVDHSNLKSYLRKSISEVINTIAGTNIIGLE